MPYSNDSATQELEPTARWNNKTRLGRSLGRSKGQALLRLVATLLVASVVDFTVINVLPGSPGQVILGTQGTPQKVAALNKALGLTSPIYDQYFRWLGDLVTVKLGRSYVSGNHIGAEIAQALQVTAPLVLGGLVIGIALSLPLAFVIYLLRETRFSVVVALILDLGISTPSFILGLVLTYTFAIRFSLLPASGFIFWSVSTTGALRSLVLPCFALGLVEAAIVSRYAKNLIEEVMSTPYVQAARLRGQSETQAFLRHGLRNISAPLVTVVGLEASGLLVGAVVVENVFGLPGVGTLLLNAVQNRDLIVVQDVVMLAVTLVSTINLLVDLSYKKVQPGLRDEIL